MPSSRSTLSLLVAFVYGTSVLAMPLGNSHDLAERDYSDLAEFDARMLNVDFEEYYLREGEVTPPATPVVATPQTNGVPAPHHHRSPGHRHSKYPHSQGNAQKEVGSSAVTKPSPDVTTRKPKGGKGRKWQVSKGRGRKGKVHKGKGRGRKGKGKKDASVSGDISPVPVTDAATTPGDAEPSVTGRDLFEVADEDLSAREPKNGKGGKVSKGKSGGSPPKKKGNGQTDVPTEVPTFFYTF